MKQIFVATLTVTLVLTLLFSESLHMPETAQMYLPLGLIVTALIYIGLVWQEKTVDERDVQHAQIAGRFAYVSTVVIVLLSIFLQSLQHSIDPHLYLILGTLVISKTVARAWLSRYK